MANDKVLNMHMPQWMYEAIQSEAKKSGVSLAALVRLSVEEHIKRNGGTVVSAEMDRRSQSEERKRKMLEGRRRKEEERKEAERREIERLVAKKEEPVDWRYY